MSIQVTNKEFEKVAQDYTKDLAVIGYNLEWRAKVLLSAIKGYTRILSKETPRNRQGYSTRTARRHKRVIDPATWFQTKQNEK